MSSIALSRKALATIGALALTFGAFSLNVAAAHAEDVSDQNGNTSVSEQNDNTQGTGNADVSGQDGNADVSGQDGNADVSGQDSNGGFAGGGNAAITTSDDVVLSAYTVVPGQTITVSTTAGLFAPGESVDIELHSDVKVLKSGAVANENGVINEQVTIPLDAELGTHHIVVDDLTSADLKIVAADASSNDTGSLAKNDTGSLAKTGLESGALLAGALLIIAAGAATVAAARRRSAQH